MNIGIVFAGISIDLDSEFSSCRSKDIRIPRDYRMHFKNQFEFLINPLKENNNVTIYLNTYQNNFIDDLKLCYNTNNVFILDKNQSGLKYAFCTALENIIEENLDFIILTRFDIDFLINFCDLNIDYNKINFAFKEYHPEYIPMVGDCIFLLNAKFIQIFIDAIKKQDHFSLHFIVDSIDKQYINYLFDFEMITGINILYNTNNPYKNLGGDYRYAHDLRNQFIDIVNNKDQYKDIAINSLNSLWGYNICVERFLKSN